jgi:hypothetical protein
MSKFKIEVKENELIGLIDTNEDGQPVGTLKLNLNEAFQEAFQKGGQIEGAKLAGFKFSLTKLIIEIDTDKDGEKLLTFEIDLAEAVDEIGLLK